LHSASVEHWHTIRLSVELIAAHVFALEGQSAPAVHVCTQIFAVGWQISDSRQSVSAVHVVLFVSSAGQPVITTLNALNAVSIIIVFRSCMLDFLLWVPRMGLPASQAPSILASGVAFAPPVRMCQRMLTSP
jgi:hypothetical protein